MTDTGNTTGCGRHHGFKTRGRLYRDRENGWLFGVCAGLAEYLGIRVLVVRAVATGLLLIFTVATGLAYLAATLLLRERPLTWSGRDQEREFWRCRGRDDHWSTS